MLIDLSNNCRAGASPPPYTGRVKPISININLGKYKENAKDCGRGFDNPREIWYKRHRNQQEEIP